VSAAASVAVVEGGRVLLIERARAPYAGCWTLPGGTCDPGETPEDCARRELAEELGLVPGPLHPVTEHRAGKFVLSVYCTRGDGTTPRPDAAEIAAWAMVAPEEIAGLRTTPGLAAVVAQALERIGQEETPCR
jgi:ADP-ribose pyrophosphatase YjhB (NUDIX family)